MGDFTLKAYLFGLWDILHYVCLYGYYGRVYTEVKKSVVMCIWCVVCIVFCERVMFIGVYV